MEPRQGEGPPPPQYLLGAVQGGLQQRATIHVRFKRLFIKQIFKGAQTLLVSMFQGYCRGRRR